MITYKDLIVEWRWVGVTPCLVELYPKEEGRPFIFPKSPDSQGRVEVEGVSVSLPLAPSPLSKADYSLFCEWLKEELESLKLQDKDKFDELLYSPAKVQRFLQPFVSSYLDDKGFASFTKSEARTFKVDYVKPMLRGMGFNHSFFLKSGWTSDFAFFKYYSFGKESAVVRDCFETEERRTPGR